MSQAGYREFLRDVVKDIVDSDTKKHIADLRPDVRRFRSMCGNLISQAIANNDLCGLEMAAHNINLAIKAYRKGQVNWADPGTY